MFFSKEKAGAIEGCDRKMKILSNPNPNPRLLNPNPNLNPNPRLLNPKMIVKN
jgi:hypothetical protein